MVKIYMSGRLDNEPELLRDLLVEKALLEASEVTIVIIKAAWQK
jgi:hypothetical protein